MPRLACPAMRRAILTVAAAAAWEIYQRGPTVLSLPTAVSFGDGYVITVDDDGLVTATRETGTPSR